MSSQRAPARTIGRIARELNEPIHRVDYAIRTRGIEPEFTAGHLRVFSEDAAERIAEILLEIDSHRSRRAASARQEVAR
jgi:hypothetical protein